MAQAVVMPKLGQTVEEAAIVKWHKKEGDTVKKGDVLFEIETDKAVLEAESFHDGTLLKIFVQAGGVVPVQSVVAYVGEPGEAVPEPPKAESRVSSASDEREKPKKKSTPRPSTLATPAPEAPAAPRPSTAVPPVPQAPVLPERKFVSPRAKAMARQYAVAPANITGSGPHGRVTARDVQAYLDANRYDRIRITPAALQLARKEAIDIVTVRARDESGRLHVADIERAVAEKPKTMSKMRQVIARRLTESFTSTPHFYVTVAADMTELLAFRQELKAAGQAYTVTDFILQAVVLSLQEFPIVNSVTDGQVIRWYGSIDLGIAVSLEEGLVVPVIRNAGGLSLAELHDEARRLAGKARDGKLLPDEMSGSTFTLSNMGMMNVENFAAIINPGEGAILAVSSTVETPVAVDGSVAIRSIMKMTLSCDHRIIDGAKGAEFTNAIRTKLEDIELWKSLT